MSEPTISIITQTSADDIKRVLFRQVRTRFILTSGALAFFGILLIFGVGLSFLSERGMPLFFYLPLLIPVVLFSLALLLLILTIGKQAKQAEENSEPTKFVFDEQGMIAESDSSFVKTIWTKFSKVEETQTDFLIYVQKNIITPIPKRFFAEDIQINKFRQLLSRQLGDRAKLKV